MQYVVFPKGEQAKFLREVKTKSEKSLAKLAKEVGKSKASMSYYSTEKTKMKLATYNKLTKYAHFQELPTIELKNTPVDCVLPEKMSDALAEFLGALAGDGHLGVQYQVCIILSNLVDREYSEHVKKIFKSLFDLDARFSVRENARRVNVYSKKLQLFLHEKYGLPIGKKKGRLHIPQFDNNEFLLAYLRGLFDTDGSFYERGFGRGVVNICSLDSIHMQEVADALRKNGFKVCVSGKDLYIYRREHIKRFFEEIKPANVKHVRKYELFMSRLEKGRYV